MLKSYNPENTKIIFDYTDSGGNEIRGIVRDWEEVTVEFEDDRFTHTTTTSGFITSAKVINRLGHFNFTLPQGGDLAGMTSQVGRHGYKVRITLKETQVDEAGDLHEVALWILDKANLSDNMSRTRGREASTYTARFSGELQPLENKPYVV